MSEESNVVAMPEQQSAQGNDIPENLTPEEMDKLRQQAAAEREEARLSHLKGAATNPCVVRDEFQQTIIMAILEDSNKVLQLCEDYYEWARIHNASMPIDYSDVTKEVDMIIERYSASIHQNSITGLAHFMMLVKTTIPKKDKTLNPIIRAYGLWVQAEAILNSEQISEIDLDRIYRE